MSDLEPSKVHNGGHSTDGVDPEMVKALARRIIRPLRERAKVLGYAIAVHGSLERDIDLIAAPWTVEVGPNLSHPKPHGRLCWSWWIRNWTYIDLSILPPIGALE